MMPHGIMAPDFLCTAMDKEERRRQVIEACIAAQRQVAAVARQEMDSAQQQSNDYGAAVDRYDSYRTKMMRQRDMYARQLSNANAALRVLGDLLRQPVMSCAAHGALVVTNRQRFFLSVGIGKFMVPYQAAEEAQQETWFAISAQVPAFLAMRGLKEGDDFTCNGICHTIREIL